MRLLAQRYRRITTALMLAAALVLAQGLGLAHRVLHAPGTAKSDTLFGQHDRAGCQLYDQLAHGDALTAALPSLPPAALPQACPVDTGSAGVAVAATAAYRARAPPRG